MSLGSQQTMTSPPTCQRLEVEFDAFYDRLIDMRHQPPDQTIEQLQQLFLGALDQTDDLLAHHWCCIAQNVGFAPKSIAFFNRSFHILINYWTTHSSAREASSRLVQLLRQLSQPSQTSDLPWHLRLVQFCESPEFHRIEQRVKADQPSSEEPRRLPLQRLAHHYPFLYLIYFTKYDKTEESLRAVQQLKERRERDFDTKLLRWVYQLGRNESAADHSARHTNPTFLEGNDLAASIHEFVGAPQASHSYQASAQACLAKIKCSPSNQQMKAHILDYLVEGLQAYGRCLGLNEFGCAWHRCSNWLKQKLQSMQVELDLKRPSPCTLVQTCEGLLDSLLANPAQTTSRDSHVQFINLNANLGSQFIAGLILKILMLCRELTDSLTALRHSVAAKFVNLFEHYENSPTAEGEMSNVAWLVDLLENYMVASAIHFTPNNPASMWRQMLRV